jgi:phosphomannomutase
VLGQWKKRYAKQPVNTIDGVKIEFDKGVGALKQVEHRAHYPYRCQNPNATANHLANKSSATS